MWVPLAVLAVLATIGGFVGVGPAFKFVTGSEHPGGRLNIVNFMDPIIWNPETREFGKEHAAAGAKHVEETAAPAPAPIQPGALAVAGSVPESAGTVAHETSGFNLAHAAEKALGSHLAAEWLFIVISLLVGGIGIALGWLFYVKNPRLPELWTTRLKPLYQASYNKYWVDEFYGWAFTRRVMDAARAVFAFDSKVIDGAVNGSAWITRLSSRITGGTDRYVVDGFVNTVAAFIIRLMSPLFRAAQTGFIQNYALVMVLGLVAAVALFFGADIMRALKSVFALGI
jgi:NADH:ubiquinone oxidoreductase subunit 5 (subunit L)/multisubunit Na+/H+ antiporter MnhA subunit